MQIRDLTGLSDTYMTAIYDSYITMRGSGTNLQSDIYNRIAVLSNYTRTKNNTLTGDATSALTSYTGTHIATGADTDLISVAVGKVLAGTNFVLGDVADNHIKVGTQSASVSRFHDGAATDTANTGTKVQPSDGDLVVCVAVRDQGNEAYGYCWNFTTNALAWETLTVSGATTAAITPEVNKGSLLDWTEFYGGMVFEFAAAGLPSTWKADMVAMANTLISKKG